MSLKDNPYTDRRRNAAWSRGYKLAQREFIDSDIAAAVKEAMTEQFIQSLIEVVQEYGGDRFIYTAGNQEELEEFLGDLDVGTDQVSEALAKLMRLWHDGHSTSACV